MKCEYCNSANMEVIDNKKQAVKLFLLGIILFPVFFIFWALALISLFAKPVYHCKDCKKASKQRD